MYFIVSFSKLIHLLFLDSYLELGGINRALILCKSPKRKFCFPLDQPHLRCALCVAAKYSCSCALCSVMCCGWLASHIQQQLCSGHLLIVRTSGTCRKSTTIASLHLAESCLFRQPRCCTGACRVVTGTCTLTLWIRCWRHALVQVTSLSSLTNVDTIFSSQME